jgi:hypothetical protein
LAGLHQSCQLARRKVTAFLPARAPNVGNRQLAALRAYVAWAVESENKNAHEGITTQELEATSQIDSWSENKNA